MEGGGTRAQAQRKKEGRRRRRGRRSNKIGKGGGEEWAGSMRALVRFGAPQPGALPPAAAAAAASQPAFLGASKASKCPRAPAGVTVVTAPPATRGRDRVVTLLCSLDLSFPQQPGRGRPRPPARVLRACMRAAAPLDRSIGDLLGGACWDAVISQENGAKPS